MNVLEIKITGPEDMIPHYASKEAAGADLRACIDSALTIPPGQRVLVPTGLRMVIPSGYEGQLRPRSGLALNKGLTLLNSPGTIDADYRGEIKIILINLGTDLVQITRGERIAQLVITPVIQGVFSMTENLEETERGRGGFGSTGEK